MQNQSILTRNGTATTEKKIPEAKLTAMTYTRDGREDPLQVCVRRFQAILVKVDDGSASLAERIELEQVSNHISRLLCPKQPPPPPAKPTLPIGINSN